MKFHTRALVLSLILVAPLAVAGPCHDQPNMAAALVSLNQAKASLERAESDKGGWREAAIEAVNKAIQRVNEGCATADSH